MMCQRCGKACANRTEGRRVRLTGKDQFFCNVCSLYAVLHQLGQGGACVSDLVVVTGQSQPLVSGRLARLRCGGLVEARSDRKRRVYRVRPDRVAEVVGLLRAVGVIDAGR